VTGRLQWVRKAQVDARQDGGCVSGCSQPSKPRSLKYRERKLHMVLLEVVNANRHFTSDQINW